VVHLPPRELAALRLLLAHAGQVVSPVLLKNALWGDVHVTADSVPKCMSSLRARLEPDNCIQTVYKRGYRFTAEIRRNSEAPAERLVRLAIMPFATGHSVPEHLGSAMSERPPPASLARAALPLRCWPGIRSSPWRSAAHRPAYRPGTESRLRFDRNSACILFALPAAGGVIRVEDGTQIWVEDLLAPQNRTSELEQQLMRRLAYRLSAGVPSTGLRRRVEHRVPSIGLRRRGGAPGSPSTRGPQPAVLARWVGGQVLVSGWDVGGSSNAALSQQRVMPESISLPPPSTISRTKRSQACGSLEIFLRGRHEWQTLHRHACRTECNACCEPSSWIPS